MSGRNYVWILCILLLFLVSTRTLLFSTLFSLLVLGMVPGTNLIIPSWVTLILNPLIMLCLLYWMTQQHFFIGETLKPVKNKSSVVRSSATKKIARPKRTGIAAKRRPRTAT